MRTIKKKAKEILEVLGVYQTVYRMVLLCREKRYKNLTEEKKACKLMKWYLKCTGCKLDLNNVRSFNEKIQWLKLHDNQEIKTVLSDKFLVREWVSKKIGEQYLIPIYAVWEKEQEFDFSYLPEQFVLKANHGSAMNWIVTQKAALDEKKTKRMLKRWLKTPYDLSGLEQQYFNISRRIVVEKYVEQSDGGLVDYKIHCFNGVPRIVQVIGERDLLTHTAKEAFFDLKWKRVPYMYNTYTQYDENHEPYIPECFDEMLNIAKTLSDGFAYVRVDLYVLTDGIKFGEMTFTPASGIGKWTDYTLNEMVGNWIDLNTFVK